MDGVETDQCNEDKLLSNLDSLPVVEDARKHAIKESMGGALGEVTPVLELSFVRRPDKKNGGVDLPARERITVRHHGKVTFVDEFEYGTALNDVYSLLERKYELTEPSPRLEATEAELLWYGEQRTLAANIWKTKEWLDGLGGEGPTTGDKKITKETAALFFLSIGVTPNDFDKQDGETRKAYCLFDVIFHTMYCAKNSFGNAPRLRRCKMCGRLFFASPTNTLHCYFEVRDETLHGISCKTAKDTIKTREFSTKDSVDRALRRIRRKLSDGEGRLSSDEANLFEIEYAKEREALEHHPWKYRELMGWLRRYEAGELELPNEKG